MSDVGIAAQPCPLTFRIPDGCVVSIIAGKHSEKASLLRQIIASTYASAVGTGSFSEKHRRFEARMPEADGSETPLNPGVSGLDFRSDEWSVPDDCLLPLSLLEAQYSLQIQMLEVMIERRREFASGREMRTAGQSSLKDAVARFRIGRRAA